MVETYIRRIRSGYWIYYRQEKIAANALSRLPNNENQDTTPELTYLPETMSELYDIEELPEGTFPLSLKLRDSYQQEDPFLTEK